MNTYDAVIIGAGHNGLVAALYLARAGWKTLVLERNPQIGGAVMSGEITRPGFIHDLYSMNQNLFLASPVYQELQANLERHGLTYCIADKPYSNVFPDGQSLRVYADQERTLDLLARHHLEDAAGWSRLYGHYQSFSQALLPLYNKPLPSTAALGALAKAVPSAGMQTLIELGQIVASSTRELADAYFVSPEAKALIATWGMHLDFGPDVSGGAMFPLLESFSNMEKGMAIPRGGAGRLVLALAGLLREQGGEIRTEAEVAQILTEHGRATGVHLTNGEVISAKRAVIANLNPTVLFERLLRDAPLPDEFWRKVHRYAYGPGTMMVHLALRGQPQWAAGEDLHEFAYVHIPPYVDDLAQTYTQSINGYLPASPLLIVGQSTAIDPSRAPAGNHILWIQVRTLPSQIQGDAANVITAHHWDEAKEPFAERVVEKLAAYAPGIRDQILDQVVYSPADLERHNPNLIGGDSIAGSHHLRQNFLWRPFPGWSTYQMPLDNLWMVGAATWPGAGTNATSGYLAAQELLNRGTLRKALVGAAAAGVGVAARLWRDRRATDGAHTAAGDGAPSETPYRRLAESQGNVLGYELTGHLTEAAYQALRDKLRAAIKSDGQIRLLLYLPELHGFDPAVINDDLRFATHHLDNIERMAVVGDSALVAWTTQLSDAVTPTKARYFDSTELTAAWRWVKAEEPAPAPQSAT